jgi:hypothetical protein
VTKIYIKNLWVLGGGILKQSLLDWPWTHDPSASVSKCWDYRCAHHIQLDFFFFILTYS